MKGIYDYSYYLFQINFKSKGDKINSFFVVLCCEAHICAYIIMYNIDIKIKR